jgi:Uma2 family endonuclease
MVSPDTQPITQSVTQPVTQFTESATTHPSPAPPRYSAEAYLAMEVKSVESHEYWDGVIIPRAVNLPNHNRILRNLCTALHVGLEGQAFEVFAAAQRVWIPQERAYVYPDVMVIQGELELQVGRNDTVVNPLLVVEVLSPSSQDEDSGDKFDAYGSIPGFQEYLLVNQYRQKIMQYVRTGQKTWNFQIYDETDPVVQLQSIGLEIPIAAIYNKVKFEEDSEADREVGPEPAVGSDQPG